MQPSPHELKILWLQYVSTVAGMKDRWQAGRCVSKRTHKEGKKKHYHSRHRTAGAWQCHYCLTFKNVKMGVIVVNWRGFGFGALSREQVNSSLQWIAIHRAKLTLLLHFTHTTLTLHSHYTHTTLTLHYTYTTLTLHLHYTYIGRPATFSSATG